MDLPPGLLRDLKQLQNYVGTQVDMDHREPEYPHSPMTDDTDLTVLNVVKRILDHWVPKLEATESA
jgi:hypothetical protein